MTVPSPPPPPIDANTMQSILLRYVRSHGVIAWASGSHHIGALDAATYDGRLRHRVVILPATAAIIRAWLGY